MKHTYKGITYTAELIDSEVTKYKFDGGIVGGIFFESQRGKFGYAGQSGSWKNTFEEAAEHEMAVARLKYETAKKITDAFEKHLAETKEKESAT